MKESCSHAGKSNHVSDMNAMEKKANCPVCRKKLSEYAPAYAPERFSEYFKNYPNLDPFLMVWDSNL